MGKGRTLLLALGAFVGFVFICHVAGDQIIAVIQWAQGFGFSHK